MFLPGYDAWKTDVGDWPSVEDAPDVDHEPDEGWEDFIDWAWCVWADACLMEAEEAA